MIDGTKCLILLLLHASLDKLMFPEKPETININSILCNDKYKKYTQTKRSCYHKIVMSISVYFYNN